MCILFAARTVVFASESNDSQAKFDEFKSQKIDNLVVERLINDYFNNRESYLKTDRTSLRHSLELKRNKTIFETAMLEKNFSNITTKSDIENLFGINVVDTDIVSSVKNVCKSIKDDTTIYDIDVYEWTWVYYNYTENTEVDKMGYGTQHAMGVEVNSVGDANIVYDEYEDFIFSENNGFQTDNSLKEEKLNVDMVAPHSIYADSLNVNTLIDYADEFVSKSYATDSGTSAYQYYNTKDYYYENGNDCANYVSQCLRAGLMPLDKGANNSYDTSSSATDDWWYNRNQGSSLGSCSSYSWRTVDGLINYLKQEGLSLDTINTAQSNVFPGNPVITGNKGHVAICVGYNSAGKPIINGHTRDVYHTPIARGTGGNYYYTFRIFARNTMEQTPTDATTLNFSSTSQVASATIVPKASKYYKFNVSAKDDYRIKFGINNTSNECTAVIYKKTQTSKGLT